MTPSVTAAPLHGCHAPCGLAAATLSVPSTYPDFEPFQRKAGRK